MVENILILDTETTGLDPSLNCQLIEIGALLYNIRHKQVIQTFGTFLPCAENPVENINHIKAEWTQCNPNTHSGIHFLRDMAKNASCIVAHNAEFDKKFIKTVINDTEFWEKKWICTRIQFVWPEPTPRRRLEDICAAMKVPYVHAHRALADCNLLAQCFDNVNDLQERFDSFIL